MAESIETITGYELRRRAQHMVALDGGWADTGLSQEELDATIEDAVLAEEKRIRETAGVKVLENTHPGYGINEKDLKNCFQSRSQGDKNFFLLKMIWHGINYVELEGVYGVPHNMLSSMNTFEILALYRGFGKLIRDGYVGPTKTDRITKEELKEMPAEQVASKLVGYGCKYAAMIALRQKGYTEFPTGPGDLVKRIELFDKQTKDRLMRLLDISEPEVPEQGKEALYKCTASFMHRLYRANTQKA
jgi:hypothetical protein